MENSKIAALVELGILCRGEPVEVHGDGVVDPGPHAYSGHNQLCRYEDPRFRYPFDDQSVPAYAYFAPDTTIEQALAQTRLVVMLGVADSPQFRACLESPNTILVLFEPDERVLVEFLDQIKLADLNRQNFFCFTGNPYSFNPALQDLLPGDMFKMGTPAVFMTDRIREKYSSWAFQVTEYFEVLHYRHVVYPLSGQSLARSRPLRSIYRGALYDQQLHAYENVADYMTAPSIASLRNCFTGLPAILVAAGPDLSEKFDYIRANKDRGVVICVNNAVKPLVEAGIHPHFVVINDTSVASGKVFRSIPELPETILVAHCLSDLGRDKFRKKYLFGSHLPELFGPREMLRLHGSVISTAFSLASHFGCGKRILIGAQLASDNPWGLSYAKGALKEKVGKAERPLINQYPQLYPVATPFGGKSYTTINFRDAALWLSEVIRLSGVECVNTTKASILYGTGIEYDPAPTLPEASVLQSFAKLFRTEPPRVDLGGVRKYVRHEITMWTSVHDVAKSMLQENGPALEAKGMAILKQLDGNNITYLVERRVPFSNQKFVAEVFQGSAEDRQAGLRYYFGHVKDMCEEFIALLKKAAREI